MIRLPLSALSDMCHRRKRIASFVAHHQRKPNTKDRLVDWWAVTPDVSDRLWAVAVALPRAYPHHAVALRRIVVEVAWRAAMRMLATFETARPGDGRPRAALDIVRKWLDGEPVTPRALWDAGVDAADAAFDADPVAADVVSAAHTTVAAAARAANDVTGILTADAAAGGAADAWCACGTKMAERDQQRADLDELLTALFTSEPPCRPTTPSAALD